MVAASCMPLAYVTAGPLADRLFEPLMGTGGPLASSIGHWIGTGPGRGIALAFVVAGLLLVVLALAAWLHPRVRRVQEELPDATPADSHTKCDEVIRESAD
jgi:hypothetical protein